MSLTYRLVLTQEHNEAGVTREHVEEVSILDHAALAKWPDVVADFVRVPRLRPTEQCDACEGEGVARLDPSTWSHEPCVYCAGTGSLP